MSNKSSCPMKRHSMRKMPKFAVISVFFIFCSICLYAQEEKTKVDKDKFDKLTLEQKKEFVERAKETRDTALESVKQCVKEEDLATYPNSTKICNAVAKEYVEERNARVGSIVADRVTPLVVGGMDAKETKQLKEIQKASKEVFEAALKAYEQKEIK